MGELVVDTKEHLESLLNAHSISMDSIEGIIIIFALAFIAWGIYKKAMGWVKWSLAVILFCEFMYWLGQTSFNNFIPVSEVFRYDILMAIAQVFVGTKVCDGILWVDAFIRSVCITVVDFIQPYASKIGEFFSNAFHAAVKHLEENVEPLPTPETTPAPSSDETSAVSNIVGSAVNYFTHFIRPF